jgi:hypothetical protein
MFDVEVLFVHFVDNVFKKSVSYYLVIPRITAVAILYGFYNPVQKPRYLFIVVVLSVPKNSEIVKYLGVLELQLFP